MNIKCHLTLILTRKSVGVGIILCLFPILVTIASERCLLTVAPRALEVATGEHGLYQLQPSNVTPTISTRRTTSDRNIGPALALLLS